MSKNPTATRCVVHRVHSPKPLRFVPHHILPQAMGGKTESSNLVEVCDTGHYNIHRLLNDLLNGTSMRKGGTKAERALAQRGYDEWVSMGKPGKPVYELGMH